MSVSQEKKTDDRGEDQPYEVTLEQALKLAVGHHKSGNFAIAERTYRDVLRAYPDHATANYLIGTVLFQRGNIREALEYAKKATELEAENVNIWSNYAAILSANKDYEGALAAYDSALYLDPELYEIYVNKSYTLWQMKRYEEAEEVALQATMIDPDKPDAYMNLGLALASQGKNDDASYTWKHLIELDPNSAKAYANWCNVLRLEGSIAAAQEKGQKAVELDPNYAEAHNNLGCVYQDLGNSDKAIECFREARNVKPDYVDAHNNLARTYLMVRKFNEALVAARYAASFDDSNAYAYIFMAQAYNGLHKYDEARQNADKAIVFDPENAYHYLVLVDILIGAGMDDESYAVMRRAIELEPNEPYALIKLAEIYGNLDMIDKAIASIDKALEVSQETPHLLGEKAKYLLHYNQIEEAVGTLDHALALFPNNPSLLLIKADTLLTINRKEEARKILESSREILREVPGFYLNIGSYKKYKKDDPDFLRLQEMEKNLAQYAPEGQVGIQFALFQAYEHIGDYDRAFEYLKAANDGHAAIYVPDYEATQKTFDKKKEDFSKDVIKQFEGLGYASDLPVFIVGMPRSGTTLTEQIVSSHPSAFGAGELYDLGSVVRELGPLEHVNASDMGEAYVKKVMARDKSGQAIRITDKMPGNYMSLGLIKCILPQARIIHCRRNPMDTLLSCYKQNFATGHYWSYDLDGLADQYLLYLDLMEYWRNTLPQGSFIEIDYEETATNFESQARALIEYTGLPWDEACLKPHQQERAILTASKNQVIKPVYTSSIDSWRRYEKQLVPVYDKLQKAGVVD